MSDNSALPVLFSIRGWPEGVNPEYLAFIDEMCSAGIEVIDTYVPALGLLDIEDWASAVIEQIDQRRDGAAPLHLLAYCLGGNLTLVLLHQLERAGVPIGYVGFIDVREDSESHRLAKGLDAAYEVPWGVRFRELLIRLTPPDRESLGAVLGSVARRSVRSVVELPRRGWRGRKFRRAWLFHELRMSYSHEYTGVTTPITLYNTAASMDRFDGRDPSLNIGMYLRGGYVIRFIEGTHESCIQPPHSADLIARITADRRRPIAER